MNVPFRLILASVLLILCNLSARGELRFQKKIVNLGKLKSGLPLTCNFPFQNVGAEPLEIFEVRGGCGCVVPEVKQRMFGSRENGVLPVRINTLGESAGPHRWYVHVLYGNNNNKRAVALQILADVVLEVTVQPAVVNVQYHKDFTSELLLTDFRTSRLHVTGVRSTLPGLETVTGKPARNRNGKWTVPIALKFAKVKAKGEHIGYVIIDTNDDLYRQFKVPLKIRNRTANRLTARPDTVELTGVSGRTLPSKLLVVRDSQNQPVVIDKIESTNPALKHRWAKGPGNLATVRIWADVAQLREGAFQSAIRIHVAEPQHVVITVPVKFQISSGK